MWRAERGERETEPKRTPHNPLLKKRPAAEAQSAGSAVNLMPGIRSPLILNIRPIRRSESIGEPPSLGEEKRPPNPEESEPKPDPGTRS
ncbi:hypothetical protein AOLI_G00055080 [Acnodon oligacanthus]